jgi:hypothetical protein
MCDKHVTAETNTREVNPALSGIRTHNPGIRGAADLCFRAHGQLDQRLIKSPSDSICGRLQIWKHLVMQLYVCVAGSHLLHFIS